MHIRDVLNPGTHLLAFKGFVAIMLFLLGATLVTHVFPVLGPIVFVILVVYAIGCGSTGNKAPRRPMRSTGGAERTPLLPPRGGA